MSNKISNYSISVKCKPYMCLCKTTTSNESFYCFINTFTLLFFANCRLVVYERSSVIVDTKTICDKTKLKGGKLGVFVFSQESVIWSDLRTECIPGNVAVFVCAFMLLL